MGIGLGRLPSGQGAQEVMSIEERHDLPPRTSHVGRKGGGAGTAGDPFAHCPRHGLRILCAAGHVSKVACPRCGTPSQLPEVGDGHASGAGRSPGKGMPGDELFFMGPSCGFGIIVRVCYIAERVFDGGFG